MSLFAVNRDHLMNSAMMPDPTPPMLAHLLISVMAGTSRCARQNTHHIAHLKCESRDEYMQQCRAPHY
jgi:hypothetical protein